MKDEAVGDSNSFRSEINMTYWFSTSVKIMYVPNKIQDPELFIVFCADKIV